MTKARLASLARRWVWRRSLSLGKSAWHTHLLTLNGCFSREAARRNEGVQPPPHTTHCFLGENPKPETGRCPSGRGRGKSMKAEPRRHDTAPENNSPPDSRTWTRERQTWGYMQTRIPGVGRQPRPWGGGAFRRAFKGGVVAETAAWCLWEGQIWGGHGKASWGPANVLIPDPGGAPVVFPYVKFPWSRAFKICVFRSKRCESSQTP